MKESACLIQSATIGSCYEQAVDYFINRHTRYCERHGWSFVVYRDAEVFGWGRISRIMAALTAGHKYICYMDADAVISDLSIDLRDAMTGTAGGLGTVESVCPSYGVHRNVGVTYAWDLNGEATKAIEKWWKGRGGKFDVPTGYEQNVFNNLLVGEKEYQCPLLDAKWNAIINLSMVPNPVVVAAHGQGIPEYRAMLLANWLRDNGKL